MEVSMKMLGVTDLSQLHPGLVNTLDVEHLVPATSEQSGDRKKSRLRSPAKARL